MKPSLVIFTPLPPVKNGIADYAASLMHFHEEDFDCIVVLQDSAPEPVGLPETVLVIRECEYREKMHELRQCRHLFHVGNNRDHVYMMPYLRGVPGVVVIHDLSYHHLLREAYSLESFHGFGFIEAIWEHHGFRGKVLAEAIMKNNWTTTSNYVEMPWVAGMLKAASAAIVHSAFGLARVKAEKPRIAVHRINHFAEIPKGDRRARRREARRRLGLPLDNAMLCSIGFVTNSKQILATMDALVEIVGRGRPFFYLLVGQENDFSISQEIDRRGLKDIVQHIGYVAESDLGLYLDATDILINLRYPTFGETSGSLCRALAHGTCALVSNHGWYAELPDEAVIKIRPQPDIADIIAGNLMWLLSDRKAQFEIELEAQRYAREKMDIRSIASQYRDAILAVPEPGPQRTGCPERRALQSRPSGLELAKRGSGLRDDERNPISGSFLGKLWWSKGMVPVPLHEHILLVSGPAVLAARVEELIGIKAASKVESPVECGLYVGTWSDLLYRGDRIARFALEIAQGGLALIDVWTDSQDRLSEPLDVRLIGEVLDKFDLKLAKIVEDSSQMVEGERLEQSLFQEVAFLVRKVT